MGATHVTVTIGTAAELREIYKKHFRRYSFWIQKSISYDATLTGTPDYVISPEVKIRENRIRGAYRCRCWGKKNDFDQGWGQCLAELVAQQKLNENPQVTVYGIVTDGNLWKFGRLVIDLFTKNTENFTIDKLPMLYGALEYYELAKGLNRPQMPSVQLVVNRFEQSVWGNRVFAHATKSLTIAFV